VRVFQRAVGDAQRLGEALYLPLGYSVKLPPSPLRVRASYRACRWVRSVRRMLGRWLTAAADRMNGSL
jgi:hypothetical protein